MGVIPTFQGTRLPRVQPPGGQISPGVARRQGEAVAEAGEAILQVTEKFRQLRDLNEFMKAKTATGIRLNEVDIEAREDPDIWNAEETARKKIQDSRSEITDGISSPLAKAQFAGSYDLAAESTMQSIRSNLRKRQVDDQKVTLFNEIDRIEDDYADETEPEKRKTLILELKEAANATIKSGAIDAKEGRKLTEESIANMEVARAKRALEINARQFLVMSKEGDFDIDQKTKLDLETKARKQIEKDFEEGKKGLKDIQDKTEIEAIQGLGRGELQLDGIETLETENNMLPVIAEALRKAVVSAKTINPVTDGEVYVELYERTGDPDEPVEDVMLSIIEEYAAGRLEPVDLQDLSGRIAIEFQDEANKQRNPWFGRMFKSLKQYVALGSLEGMAAATLLSNLTRKTMADVKANNLSGRDIENAGQRAIRNQIVDENPGISGLEDIPNSIYDQNRGFDNVSNSTSKANPVWVFNPTTGKLERFKEKVK